MERWKDIEGCDGLFQASNEGRIKIVTTFFITLSLHLAKEKYIGVAF